jgi:monoterpene epsilon-lactone hydrolase
VPGALCAVRCAVACRRCSGGSLTDEWEQQIIKDKPWIVYVHGGDFRYYNNINGGYGFLSSHVAQASGMGVLAVDYHSAAQYPQGVRDVVQACQWLTSKGASEIFLYGDSSGGTIVAETLLWIAHHKLSNNSLGVSISGAATFSAWLDFTASSPTYESVRWCDGSCYGTGDPVEKEPPGWARMSAFCDAQHYTGPDTPYNLPIVNPMSSPPYLLAELPPMMLVIGSRDILLGDNLAFAQAAQAAGAAVQVEVFEGMWHDFEEESQGCGAFGKLVSAVHAMTLPCLELMAPVDFVPVCSVIPFLRVLQWCGCTDAASLKSVPARHGVCCVLQTEGLTAVRRVGEFFAAGGSSCKVVCQKGELCSGTAPVNWHYHVNRLPVVPTSSCGA